MFRVAVGREGSIRYSKISLCLKIWTLFGNMDMGQIKKSKPGYQYKIILIIFQVILPVFHW